MICSVPSFNFRPSNDFESDPKDLAIINRCRLLLIEAGADPTSSGDSIYNSLIGDMLDIGTPVFQLALYLWTMIAKELKETISLVLDHGFHFVELDGDLTPDTWLQKILSNCHWHLGSITLLLRRQGKGGLPIQRLNGCLDSAILGSDLADLDDMKAALILLIRGGADVYARHDDGYSVSDIVCMKETEFGYSGNPYRSVCNHDLLLRKIWMEALSACGYDAEEVISTARRIEELPDTDDESTSAQNEECDSAGSDGSGGDTDSPTSPMDEGWGAESRYQDDDVDISANLLHPHNQYERSLLEGDTEIWGS